MGLSGEGSITLDRKAFKALASETRVEILKRLDGTQKTVSDLARDMDMNKATMFEHLEQLVEVGLVRKDSEEERATTVKTAPFEAPVQGPPKKWVYYRLTWKGKNVLHPERVKIAILLSAVALVLALAGLLFMATWSPGSPGPAAQGDASPPLVMDWDIGPAAPGLGVDVRVTVADNATGKVSGLDAGRSDMRWGVSSTPDALRPDLLDWSSLAFVFQDNSLTASVPQRDWSALAGSYLVIGVHLFDLAGNSAWYFRSELIRAALEVDIRFVPGSLAVSSSSTTRNIIIRATVENAGTGASGNISVALYALDPDPGRTGRASSSSHALDTDMLGPLPAGASATAELRVSASQLHGTIAYVMIDPGGNIPEVDRSDNVASLVIPSKYIQKPTAGAGLSPGFETVAALAAVVTILLLGDRMRKRGFWD